MTRDQTEHVRVQLPQGVVVGTTLSNDLHRPIDAFRGIPYALPPTGDRRFRPAERVRLDPNTVIDASQYGPAAPGKPLFANGPKLTYSEDCLTANVFRQSQAALSYADKLLPVAVYIHGGAFNRGTASMHNTASMVAWSESPHIAVSFNYRIGALGFLPSTITAGEGALNIGLRDQIFLLQWVKENIAAFGGDPDKIGHLLMYHKKDEPPLFHRVIIESGAPTSRAVRPYNAEVHEAQFQDLLREVGCPEDIKENEVLPFLQSVTYEKICAAQTAVFDKYNPSLRWAFQPVVDGDIIPRPPLETWLSGNWHKVPIMTGFTRHEGSLYVDNKLSTSSEFTDFFSHLIPLLDESEILALNNLYLDPSKDTSSPYRETRDGVGAQYKRVEAAYANYAYQAPVRQTAEFASASSVPVYLYQWALETSIIGGARHGSNMPYECCDPSVMGISESQAVLARTLNAYISSFIAEGNPNAIESTALQRPQWETYSQARPRAMVFGLSNKELVGGQPGPAAEMMGDTWGRSESEFWWSKVEKSQQ
ncbi:hypothetical protein ACHAQA_007207 [Verticillium albo-atrum]